MNLSELDYSYPEHLIAAGPRPDFRTLWVGRSRLAEINKTQLLDSIPAKDLLVINDTRVMKRRIFSMDGDAEILFLQLINENEWEVLFPARRFSLGSRFALPGQRTAELIRKGKPQILKISSPLGPEYFENYGELPLPPYIQQIRGLRHNMASDQELYQPAWGSASGSLAAPTASLHFSNQDLDYLQSRGVRVHRITLHIGLGTFLPIEAASLNQHRMHAEHVQIPRLTAEALSGGSRIWALGTTVVRALESWAQGRLVAQPDGSYQGATDLFIYPGYEFKIVDAILTNFHQPRSTLLAMIAAFADLDRLKMAYQYAIENGFKLFSYGDLSVWTQDP